MTQENPIVQEALVLKKKILMIDDEQAFHSILRRTIGDRVEVVGAFALEEAGERFAANPDLAAIVVDGCLSGYDLDTLPLVHMFRKSFNGPMIASSSVPYFREKLMEAGCDYECERKFELPQMLLRILGL